MEQTLSCLAVIFTYQNITAFPSDALVTLIQSADFLPQLKSLASTFQCDALVNALLHGLVERFEDPECNRVLNRIITEIALPQDVVGPF